MTPEQNIGFESLSTSIMESNHISFLHSNQSLSQNEQSIHRLEREMKLLRWHKLANESALQTALIRTRQMRRHDEAMKPAMMKAEQKDRKRRIQLAIEEEEARPLLVDKEFMNKYQNEELKNERMLSRQFKIRIEALKKVKGTMAERKAKKNRQKECKSIESYVKCKKRFLSQEHKRNRMLSRKVSSEKLPLLCSSDIAKNENMAKNVKTDSTLEGDQDQNNLPTILRSLDQLVELDSRIRSLEERSISDKGLKSGSFQDQSIKSSIPSMKVQTPSNRNSSRLSSAKLKRKAEQIKLTFSKHRSSLKPNNPSRPYYTADILIRSDIQKQKSLRLPNSQQSHSRRPSTVRTRMKEATAFLTQVNSTATTKHRTFSISKNKSIKEKNRNMIGKENITFNKQPSVTSKRGSKIVIKKTNRGSHLGVKTSNPHLHEFYQIRNEHSKKRDVIHKNSPIVLASRFSVTNAQHKCKRSIKSKTCMGRTSSKPKSFSGMTTEKALTKQRKNQELLISLMNPPSKNDKTKPNKSRSLRGAQSTNFSLTRKKCDDIRSRSSKVVEKGSTFSSNQIRRKNVSHAWS